MGNENANLLESVEAKPKGCCNNVSLYVSTKDVDASQITCSICFLIFNSPRVMKCKHIFCQDCIKQWGKGSCVTCPYCRIELKKHRGTFGKVDRKTQKKIEKIFLKCRNCYWTGSYCQFINDFSVQPFLDDQPIPDQNSKLNQEQESHEQSVEEQKKQNPQVQMTAQKKEHKEQQQFDEVIQVKQKSTGKGFDLFINHILQLGQDNNLEQNTIQNNYFYNPNIDI